MQTTASPTIIFGIIENPMKTNTPSSDPKTQDTATDRVEISRRRLVRGAAGGVGVMMAVSAKTALGTGICQSPSAMVSGNTSPNRDTPPPCSGGRSPGFWRVPQKFIAWPGGDGPDGATPPTLRNAAACPTGLGQITPNNICTQGTTALSIWGTAATNLLKSYSGTAAGSLECGPGGPFTIQPTDWGIWAILAFPKDVGINEGDLLWHLCAAYLNSLIFPDYALTTQQVIDAGKSLLVGSHWCPDSISADACGSKAFTSSSFVAYISGMYDINADLNFDWCTKN